MDFKISQRIKYNKINSLHPFQPCFNGYRMSHQGINHLYVRNRVKNDNITPNNCMMAEEKNKKFQSQDNFDPMESHYQRIV